MSASGEQLGEEARERALQEIIQEEEQRLGAFVLPQAVQLSPTLQVEQNWNDIRWGSPQVRDPS